MDGNEEAKRNEGLSSCLERGYLEERRKTKTPYVVGVQ